MPGGGGAKGGTEKVRSFVTFPYGWTPLGAIHKLRGGCVGKKANNKFSQEKCKKPKTEAI